MLQEGPWALLLETGARWAALFRVLDGTPFRRWGWGLPRKRPFWCLRSLGQLRPSVPFSFRMSMTESRSSSVSLRALAEALPLALGVPQLFDDLLLAGLGTMLPFKDCDGVAPADGGAAARGVIGRSSSPETVLLEAEVGGHGSRCRDVRTTRFPL